MIHVPIPQLQQLPDVVDLVLSYLPPYALLGCRVSPYQVSFECASPR